MKKILIASIMSICCAVSHAQTEVTPFVPGSTLEGVSYYLPRTAVRIVVFAEKKVTTPGDFHKYAYRYLRLQNVPDQVSTQWTIKKIGLQPHGVPDKSKAFSIKLKGRTVAPLVGLSRDGILLSINTDAQEESLPELPQRVDAKKPVNPREFMNQEMLSAGSTAKMAELCAQEIYDIRDSRNALVRGEADNTPKDGAQLQLMLNQLDVQAAAMESLFAGTESVSTEVFSFDFIPAEAMDKFLLCRFSSKLGLVDADDMSGEPIYVSVKPTETLPDAVSDEKVEQKKAKMQQGVYYNVPVRTQIELFDAHRSLAKTEIPMGQFGSVEVLSNTLFDKKTTTKVTFFQSTGGTKDVFDN